MIEERGCFMCWSFVLNSKVLDSRKESMLTSVFHKSEFWGFFFENNLAKTHEEFDKFIDGNRKLKDFVEVE